MEAAASRCRRARGAGPVTPRGGRDAVEGVETLSDRRRVLTVPEDGAANQAVRRVLTRVVGPPASAVSLETGATSRSKPFGSRATRSGVPQRSRP